MLLEIIFAILCIGFVVVVHILEGLHLLEMTEKRWPRVHKVLMSRPLSFVLVVVSIILLVEMMREHHEETVQNSEPAPKVSVPTPQSGPATTSGPNSPANTGNGNVFNYGNDKNATPKPK